jgi:hypothetical protein
VLQVRPPPLQLGTRDIAVVVIGAGVPCPGSFTASARPEPRAAQVMMPSVGRRTTVYSPVLGALPRGRSARCARFNRKVSLARLPKRINVGKLELVLPSDTKKSWSPVPTLPSCTLTATDCLSYPFPATLHDLLMRNFLVVPSVMQRIRASGLPSSSCKA